MEARKANSTIKVPAITAMRTAVYSREYCSGTSLSSVSRAQGRSPVSFPRAQSHIVRCQPGVHDPPINGAESELKYTNQAGGTSRKGQQLKVHLHEALSANESLNEKPNAITDDEYGHHADARADASFGFFEVKAGNGGEDEDGDNDCDDSCDAKEDADDQASNGPDGDLQVGVKEAERGWCLGGRARLLGVSVLGQISLPVSKV